MSDYFKSEKDLFEHLIKGGAIRPHFNADKHSKKYWVHLKDGNRVYIESGESAKNCLIGLDYWVKADI